MSPHVVAPRGAMLLHLSKMGAAAQPGHRWTPSEKNPKVCRKCPASSPFSQEVAAHPYIIEEVAL